MATVRKRGNSYQIRASCGYDINGEQIIRTMSWTPSLNMTEKQIEKELKRQTVLFDEKCRLGQVLDGSIRLTDFAEKWMKEYAETHLKANTIDLYNQLWKRVSVALGHMRLDRIQPQHLNSFYQNLLEEGVREDTKYRCLIDLKSVLNNIGHSKASFSKEFQISMNALDQITRGGNIIEANAKRVANALNMPIDKVFEPTGSKRTLTANTVMHYHKFISAMLKTAVKQGIIPSNPCQRADPPKVEVKETPYLDRNQVAMLVAALESAPVQYRVMIFLLLDSGMRRGELCGLEWKDINFEQSIIHIKRSSVYLPQKGIFDETPKTRKSIRAIHLPKESMTMLKEYHLWQLEQRLKIGDQWKECDKLFTRWNGEPIHPDTISCWFSDFVKSHNLPPITIHSLRHTNATLLIAAGTNIRTVSERLGHAQTSTTTDIYAHAIQSADAAAADALGSIIHSPLTKKA